MKTRGLATSVRPHLKLSGRRPAERNEALCQNLIGIGLLATSLEQRLDREGHAAGPEARRISGLLCEAVTQACGIARGAQQAPRSRKMPS